MKRLCCFFYAICICAVAFADTVNITWKNDDVTYDTSTCTVGGDLSVPTPPTKTGYTFVGWEVKAAKELEYVTFQRVPISYIDSGIKFDSDEIEYETKLMFQTNYQNVFGAGPDNTGTIYVAGGEGTSVFFLCGNLNERTAPSASIVAKSINTYKLYIKKSTGTVTGTVNDTVSERYLTGSITSDKNIWIGAPNSGNAGLNSKFKGDMYYFRIKKDGVLVRDFIPAKDPDGVVCFYDKVSKTFFYNQGEANFVAGPEVQ